MPGDLRWKAYEVDPGRVSVGELSAEMERWAEEMGLSVDQVKMFFQYFGEGRVRVHFQSVPGRGDN